MGSVAAKTHPLLQRFHCTAAGPISSCRLAACAATNARHRLRCTAPAAAALGGCAARQRPCGGWQARVSELALIGCGGQLHAERRFALVARCRRRDGVVGVVQTGRDGQLRGHGRGGV